MAAAASTSAPDTPRHSAYTDNDYLTFANLATTTTTTTTNPTAAQPSQFDFATTELLHQQQQQQPSASSSTANYTLDTYTMQIHKGKNPASDALFDSLVAPEYYSPESQLQMELERRLSDHSLHTTAASRSATDVASAFLNPADVFNTPLLSDIHTLPDTVAGLTQASSVPATPAQAFGLFNAPATAPLQPLPYRETHRGQNAQVDALLLSAYESYLSTPVPSASLSSPSFMVPQSGRESRLFAPLDEIRGKDVLTDDLLGQLASADPAFRQSLVHALVDMIRPAVAYQQVGAPAPGAQPPMSALLAHARTLESAAPALGEVNESLTMPPPATPGYGVAEAPLLDSLLGLLSPGLEPDAHSPMFSPSLAAMAPEDVFRSPPLHTISEENEGADDKPLSVSVCAVAKRKQPADAIDNEDCEPAKRQRFHCDICNRGFSRQYNMRTHRLTHDPRSVAARPHSCKSCRRSFTRKHDLVRHQVLHDDTSAFKCLVCSRGFARADVLDRHTRAVHKD